MKSSRIWQYLNKALGNIKIIFLCRIALLTSILYENNANQRPFEIPEQITKPLLSLTNAIKSVEIYFCSQHFRHLLSI